ncbi:MAG TPA: response regulator [Polyangiales bacterium]|nr:response regulator [Polyangiales bacterium]
MSRASIPARGLRRAIVVDDSRAMRSMLRHALEEQNFHVTEAVNGGEALRMLQEGEPPELALIDWTMPVLDGIGLISALRRDPRFARMVIVMVTSEADPVRVQSALAAGADEYIMKPLSSDVLAEKLMLLEEAGWP